MYDLILYKYKCENGVPAITFIERDDEGLILQDVPVACRGDNVYVAIRSLKQLTEKLKLPLEERLALFSKLLDLMNYELASYAELYHLLLYYLSS